MKEKGLHLPFLTSLPPLPHQCHLGCSRQKQPHLYQHDPKVTQPSQGHPLTSGTWKGSGFGGTTTRHP